MKFLNRFLWLFVGALLLNACGDDTPQVDVGPSETFNMVESLEMNPEYSLLVAAIEQAGLTDAVSNTQNITVFAPTNGAFLQLMSALGVDNLSEIDQATLGAILQYHVVPSVVNSGDVSGAALTTLQGSNLYVTASASPININGKAEIVEVDRVASNGVFHGISSVLSIPTAGNIAAVLAANGNYSLLLAAVEQAGLTAALTGDTEYTVLAPNDAAFEALGLTADVIATLPAEVLAPILGFHVFAGRKYTQEFADGYAPTILGTLADDNVQEVSVAAGGVFQGVAANMPNMTASNGVIHGIPALIFPENTIMDVFAPGESTGLDGFGFDNFGAVVAEGGVTIFNDISETYSVYVPLFSPSSLGSAEAAKNFVETFTFAGDVNMFADGAGKVTSVNGSSFFVTENGAGVFVNGSGRNSFGATSTNNVPVFNGALYYMSGGPQPLPAGNLVDQLEANGFTYMADIARLTGRLTGGDVTVFAVSNDELANFVGVPEAFVEGVDPTDPANAGIVEYFEELMDRHTIPAIAFSVDVQVDLPDLENVLGETIQFVFTENGEIRIPYFKNFVPASSNLVGFDLTASNGVIHVLDAPLDF